MSDKNIFDNIVIQPVASNPDLLLTRRKIPTIQVATVRKPFVQAIHVQRSGPNIHRVRATATPISTDPVQIVETALARVREAWVRYQSTNSRNGVYIYLTAVYQAVARWRQQNRAEEYCRVALDLLDNAIDMEPEPFAILIFCTSDWTQVEGKTRSKWSRVLRVVEAGKTDDETLKGFIKWHGGINECAALFPQI